MKKRSNVSLSFFLVCIIAFPLMLQAHTPMKSLNVGEVEESEYVIKQGEQCIPLVKVNGLYYIVDDDLKKLNLSIEEANEAFYMVSDSTGNPCEIEKDLELIDEYGQKVSSSPKLIYWGLMQSHLLSFGGHYYVPFSLLQSKWNGKMEEDTWYFKEPKVNFYLVNLEGNGNTVINKADYWLNLVTIHYYWKNSGFETTREEILLAPNESHTWPLEQEAIYVGTQYVEINGLKPTMEEQSDINSQEVFFKAYTRAERLQVLQHYFPPSSIEARMRYGVGKLKEKDIVSLIRSEKHAYYWIENDQGEKVQVPFGSVQILGERWSKLPAVTSELIEEFVNLSGITSDTDYLLWTDINRQKTYVLQRQDGTWHHVKTCICSSGKINNPTPTGIYKVQYAIPYFGLGKGYRCKNALVFFRDYMYHSILFDKTGQYIKSGQYELGSKASHGCVRLSEQDSRWLYEHIPVRTTVWIR